jgi:hypothetical protein
MTGKRDPKSRGIEDRFHDLSVDVREERLVRYITHQVEQGRRVTDIVNDPYVVQHFDEVARSRILEHPGVIKSIEESLRRQFADAGDSVGGCEAAEGEQESAGRSSDADLPDL